MERLPFELLSLILADLSREDIINLPYSIACKGLSERQLSTIFNSIDVWLDEKSLRTMIRATKHSLVLRQIKSLRFHGDELSRVSSRKFQGYFTNDYNVDAYGLDQATRHIALAGPPSPSREVVICRSGDAVEKYRRYKELYQAQENMRAQNKTMALLAKGLLRLHNPPSLVIDHRYGFSSHTRLNALLGDAWLPACEERPLNQNRSYLFELLVTISKRFRTAPHELIIENTTSPVFNLPNRVLRYIPGVDLSTRVLYRRPGFWKLRKFCLRGSSDSTFNVTGRHKSWNTECRTLLQAFFLQTCKNLEHLEISLIDKAQLEKGREGMAHLPLLGVLDIRRNRPPLRTLILENCKMIEPDLVRFVLCVSETLKTLRVINLYLTKGSRQTLFEFLGGELTLENATINGLFQQSDHYDDTAVNPFRPVVKPENLPFPFTLDDDVALDWFCRQEIKNPYASDKWLDPSLYKPTRPGLRPNPKIVDDTEDWLAASRVIAKLTKDIQSGGNGTTSTWLQRANSLHGMGYDDLAAGDAWKAIVLDDRQIMLIDNNRSQTGEYAANMGIATILHQQAEAYKRLAEILTALESYAEVEELCNEGLQKYWQILDATFVDLRSKAQQHTRDRRAKENDSVPQSFRKAYEEKWGAGSFNGSTGGGKTTFQAYPWMPPKYIHRQENVIKEVETLFKTASSNCTLTKSSIGQGADVLDVYGVFATCDVAAGEKLFEDQTALASCAVSASAPSATPRRTYIVPGREHIKLSICENCYGYTSSPISAACCTTTYCGTQCRDLALSNYHKVLCGKDFSWLFLESAKLPKSDRFKGPTWLRILATCVQSGLHPLEHPAIARLTPNHSTVQ
ncbi:hypothetical protein Q9189_004644, partial [Teloschistes chrysophthalmus]